MQALRFNEYGSPSVLQFEEIALPELKAGQALIKIEATAISPSDVSSVAGRFHSKLPCTPGRDFAGVVVRGEGWEGKQVWGTGPGLGVSLDGAHAEFLELPATWLSEKPANLSMEEAAAVGVPYLAAWESLVRAAELTAGERVLITGANGAVGRAATQIAHWRGAIVLGADIVITDSEADSMIDLTKEDLTSEARSLTGGKGVDVVLDTVGGTLFPECLNALRVGGRQVAIASPGSSRVTFDLVDFYHNQTRLIGVDTQKLTGPEIANIMNLLKEGFMTGHLRAPAVTVSPFARVIAIYQGVADHTLKGKQVLLLPS